LKKNLILLLVIGCSLGSCAQRNVAIATPANLSTINIDSIPQWDTLSMELVLSLEYEGELFSTDPLQNFYVVTAQNELLKFDQSGNMLFRYSNTRLGAITWIATHDPFHIQLYYEDFQKTILLDNTLSEIESYALSDLGYYDHTGVGLSYDNQFWILDAISGQLRKINRQGEIVLASDNLFYQFKEIPRPYRIIEYKNEVICLEEETGFLRFDNFGKYIEELNIPFTKLFQLRRGHVIYYFEGKLFAYNLKFKTTSELLSVENLALKGIRVEADLLYLYDGKSIRIYQ